ncbi:MAG: hypothetical protein Q8Q28_17580 [Pseudomonadota bacterium]|nr:hypothetical protein [Pseudomonadota bacterium]
MISRASPLLHDGIHSEGLRKRYGSGDTAVDALKDVNMRVAPGEVVGLVGPSSVARMQRSGIRELTWPPSSPDSAALHPGYRAEYRTAIIVVTHDEKIIPTFKRIYHIRDGRTYEEAGEGRAI